MFSSAFLLTFHKQIKLKMKNYFVLFLVMLLIAGCSDWSNDQNQQFDQLKWEVQKSFGSEEVEDFEISGTVITDADTLGLPSWLTSTRNYIVVADAASPPLHIISREEGRYLGSLGSSGEGPEEFTSISSLIPDSESEDSVWILEGIRSRVTKVNIRKSLEEGELSLTRTQLEGQANLFDFEQLGSRGFAATGFLNQGRLIHYDRNGAFKQYMFDEPMINAEVPVSVLQHAFQGYVTYNESLERFAVGNRHADLLEIYSMRDSSRTVVHGPGQFLPVFDLEAQGGTPVMATGQDLRFGFLDIGSTDDHIYVLYSGQTRSEAPGQANFGRTIVKYEWSGEPVSIYTLDRLILSFYITQNAMLFASSHDDIPSIIKFDLERVQ